MKDGTPPGLTRMEILDGMPVGAARGPLSAADVPRDVRALSPRQALDRDLTDLLGTGPVVTSFSGGRDSSALLALLVHIARREGLPLPRPLVLDVVGSGAADERRWQDSVLRHLRLDPAERIPVGDELDIVGPVARQGLDQHGLLWPFNAHMHVPVFQRATGATVVTGFGGDELFDNAHHFRVAQVLDGTRHPKPRDLLHLAVSVFPPAELANTFRHSTRLPWATARGTLRSRWLRASDGSAERAGWATAVRYWWGRRYRLLTEHSFDLLATDHGSAAHHPFTSPGFVWAFSQSGGRPGPGGRHRVMEALVGDLLPPEVLTRVSKAVFDDALWTRHARALADQVDPTALCGTWADPEALRREWRSAHPHILSATALQALYLQQEGRPVS